MRTSLVLSLLALALLAVATVGCATTSQDEPYDFVALSPLTDAESALLARMRRSTLPFAGYATIEPAGEWRIGDEVLYGIEYVGGGERISWTLGLRVESDVFSEGVVMFSGDGPGRALSDLGSASANTWRSDSDDDFLEFFLPLDFAFSFNTADGRKHRFHSDSILVSVRVYDEAGAEVERQISVVPATYLEWGFQEACEISLEYARTGTEFDLASLSDSDVFERSRPFAGSIAAVISLFQVLQKNKALEPILWKVVQRPSLLSIATHLGVRLTVSPQLERAEIDPRPLAGRPDGIPIHRFPIQFIVNGGVALRTTLSVTETAPPLRTGAGLIAVDGVHPRDPGRRVAIRLLASRRGPRGSAARTTVPE